MQFYFKLVAKLVIFFNISFNTQGVRFRRHCTYPYTSQNTNLTLIPKDIPTNVALICLRRNKIKVVPSNTFLNYRRCNKLDLSHNQISSLENDSFKGLSGLTTLCISHNHLSHIGAEVWNPIKKLEYLELKNNLIHVLENKSFKYLQKLSLLNLDYNFLTEINLQMWLGLKSLKFLFLAYNNIGKIKANAFKHLNLAHLCLNGNNLTHISKEMLCMLKSTNIDLRENKISELRKGEFSCVAHLDRILLWKNQIKYIESGSFAGLSSLKQLDLSENLLHTLKDGIFTSLFKLENLLLNKNKLHAIEKDTFEGLTCLKYLNLRGNNITSLKPNVFVPLKNLDKLYLSFNEIKVLFNDTFANLAKVTELYVDHNQIHIIKYGTFLCLVNVQLLDLSYNSIHGITKGVFQNLTRLHHINLFFNYITFIEPVAFSHFLNWLQFITSDSYKKGMPYEQGAFVSDVTILKLSHNNLHFIEREALQGLLKLEKLYLSRNYITCIKPGAFTDLWRLTFLDLSHNQLNALYNAVLKNLLLVSVLDFSHNNITVISNGAFVKNVWVSELNLRHNQLSVLQKETFAGLSRVKKLKLDYNKIQRVHDGAFSHFKHILQLDLNKNLLQQMTSNFFEGLHNFKNHPGSINQVQINLAENYIETIHKGAFSAIKLSDFFSLQINLSMNRITTLSWWSFISNPTHHSCTKSILADNKLYINLTGNNLSCYKGFCSISELEQRRDVDACGENIKISHNICKEDYTEICPSGDDCMDSNETSKCAEGCRRKGMKASEVNLSISPERCPFKYLCSCLPCPRFNQTRCEMNCTANGRISSGQEEFDKDGCQICSQCGCKDFQCSPICKGYPFEVINNTFGCKECKCLCPNIDCDAICGGKGLGVVINDTTGCLKCDTNCGNMSTQNNYILSMSALVTVSSIVFVLLLTSIMWLCLRRKPDTSKQLHVSNRDSLEATVLDVLVSNLNPNIALEVKESWIDPAKFTAGKLLGTGKCGVVWSGRLQTGPYSDLQVAIKKVRVKYEDKWTVENIWNKNNELKAHFKRITVKNLDNNVIEDFLKEAIIMKKLSHPNVLQMFGISVHEDKPCILLQLMSNGDLKKYLGKNGQTMTEMDQLGLALGIAKGMEYLGEQKIVHCDLAARNCLLDDAMNVKLSDFGLAKDVYASGISEGEEFKEAMPIRWMSIEAIQYSVFTTQSDVWSYGVLLWEIFSLGGFPYDGLENVDILRYLKFGHRLDQPPMTTNAVYELMLDCWNANPDERPLFPDLVYMLNKIADNEADYSTLGHTLILHDVTDYEVPVVRSSLHPLNTQEVPSIIVYHVSEEENDNQEEEEEEEEEEEGRGVGGHLCPSQSFQELVEEYLVDRFVSKNASYPSLMDRSINDEEDNQSTTDLSNYKAEQSSVEVQQERDQSLVWEYDINKGEEQSPVERDVSKERGDQFAIGVHGTNTIVEQSSVGVHGSD